LAKVDGLLNMARKMVGSDLDAWMGGNGRLWTWPINSGPLDLMTLWPHLYSTDISFDCRLYKGRSAWGRVCFGVQWLNSREYNGSYTYLFAGRRIQNSGFVSHEYFIVTELGYVCSWSAQLGWKTHVFSLLISENFEVFHLSFRVHFHSLAWSSSMPVLNWKILW